MQNFIVLGIIPGTNFEATFNFWLSLAILLASLPFVRSAWRQRSKLHVYIVALRLARFIDQYQFQVPA